MPCPLQTVACPHWQKHLHPCLASEEQQLLCSSLQNEPPVPSPCFNGRLCLYMIRSNRRCKPGTTKAPLDLLVASENAAVCTVLSQRGEIQRSVSLIQERKGWRDFVFFGWSQVTDGVFLPDRFFFFLVKAKMLNMFHFAFCWHLFMGVLFCLHGAGTRPSKALV